ncbi:hypothetical protein MUN78_04400 [Leucobacter allii]|uniref:Uncharacterized protein n=1 Tax=Leucobacter allii TaxID=2932247 RepID=A0ABY4FPB0_9MICO|nr:hypothetical protein [Leucobacter allii]UOQ58092.1 hypothetical protein MUN78_04400 [Leucobacter allii]
MWSYTIHDTITGNRIMSVAPSSGRWGRTPGGGSGEHVLQLLDAENPMPREWIRNIATPNERCIVVAWAGVPLYAGMILNVRYRRKDGTVRLKHADIRALMAQRLTFGVGGYPVGDFSSSGKTFSGLVRDIIYRAVYHWQEHWRLPIDLPADGTATRSLTSKAWEWATIEDLLQRVEKRGAAVDFDPYYDSEGRLRWATRVGTPTLPGERLEFVVTARDSPVTDLEVELDGTEQLTGVFYMGKGSEADMRYGEAKVSPGNVPVRDAARSAKDVAEAAALTQMAEKDLAEHSSAAVVWSFDLVADDTWNPALLKPGARIALETRGDPFLADMSRDLVVTGVSGDGSRVLKPEVMPA